VVVDPIVKGKVIVPARTELPAVTDSATAVAVIR
jgi:hypothetical protein